MFHASLSAAFSNNDRDRNSLVRVVAYEESLIISGNFFCSRKEITMNKKGLEYPHYPVISCVILQKRFVFCVEFKVFHSDRAL